MLPYQGRTRITNLYGVKAPAGVTYSAGYHTGIDMVGDESKLIYSVAEGTVFKAGYDKNGWGQYVVVKQTDGLFSIYAHLSKRVVAVGEKVEEGSVLGVEGATGQVTGSHLHFELRKDYFDKHSSINPAEYLYIKHQLGVVESMIKDLQISLNGALKTVEAIEKDGYNYIKLQDLRDDNILIGYDEKTKRPIVKSI